MRQHLRMSAPVPDIGAVDRWMDIVMPNIGQIVGHMAHNIGVKAHHMATDNITFVQIFGCRCVVPAVKDRPGFRQFVILRALPKIRIIFKNEHALPCSGCLLKYGEVTMVNAARAF